MTTVLRVFRRPSVSLLTFQVAAWFAAERPTRSVLWSHRNMLDSELGIILYSQALAIQIEDQGTGWNETSRWIMEAQVYLKRLPAAPGGATCSRDHLYPGGLTWLFQLQAHLKKPLSGGITSWHQEISRASGGRWPLNDWRECLALPSRYLSHSASDYKWGNWVLVKQHDSKATLRVHNRQELNPRSGEILSQF